MTPFENRERRLAFFGRAADGFTRQDLSPRRFRATLRNPPRRAAQKEDGHFVFANLTPSPPDYRIDLAGPEFQPRELLVPWPGPGPVEIRPPGEDEIHVVITGVNASRVTFASIEFLPPIALGAPVLGEGGFTTTLAAALEGNDVQEAELTSAAGLAAPQILRIVRSNRLVFRPGPYYPFPPGTTQAALRVVENTAGAPPIEDAQVRITAVNAAPVTPVNVGGVTLFQASLPTPPPPGATTPFLIGTDASRTLRTNARGDAVFYYSPATPVASLTLDVSRPGYVSQTPTIPVQTAERSFQLVSLVRS